MERTVTAQNAIVLNRKVFLFWNVLLTLLCRNHDCTMYICLPSWIDVWYHQVMEEWEKLSEYYVLLITLAKFWLMVKHRGITYPYMNGCFWHSKDVRWKLFTYILILSVHWLSKIATLQLGNFFRFLNPLLSKMTPNPILLLL